MNTIDFSPKLSPRWLVYLRNYLLDKGIDPAPVFARCNINEVTESEYAPPLATTKLITLLDEVADTANDSLLGFHMATQFHYESSALVVLAMLAAPDVTMALTTLSHFDKYVDTGIQTSYTFGEQTSIFTAELLGVDCSSTTQINEYLLAFTVHTLNTATRKKMPVTAVHFQHERSECLDIMNTYFGTEVMFGQASNRLIFDSAYLNEHLLSSNELLYDVLQGALKTYFYADSKELGFVDSVCRELMLSADRNKTAENSTSLEAIAEKLTISARSLRRRLKEEGCTFQEVKNLARERQAKYYLGNTAMTLSEVAFGVGFSELSAFSRAFKNWTGSTPQEYRSTVRKLILS